MKGLTTDLLGRACRSFLRLAYPEGEHTIPPGKRGYLSVAPDQDLGGVLVPPVCEALPAPGGGARGHSFRLGSARYPHLKLQVVAQDDGPPVFAVDTHDTIHLDPGHPDSGRWGELVKANRQLKQQIEQAWEAEGLLTFNALLRNALRAGAR